MFSGLYVGGFSLKCPCAMEGVSATCVCAIACVCVHFCVCVWEGSSMCEMIRVQN